MSLKEISKKRPILVPVSTKMDGNALSVRSSGRHLQDKEHEDEFDKLMQML